ncbi:MAG: DNA primase, partial [Actinomycetales bacterium]
RRHKPATKPQRITPARADAAAAAAPAPTPEPFVSFGAPQFAPEREALKAIAQYPHLAKAHLDDVHENDFTHPVGREVWKHLVAHGLPDRADSSFVPSVADTLPSDDLRRVLMIASSEPLSSTEGGAPAVVGSVIAHLQLLTSGRRVAEIKSKLQRTNPIDEAETYNRLFGELIALEQQHRALRDRAIGI